MFRNQYDNDVTVWSPQGRIHQIEYAMEAVKQGSATVGMKSRTHSVLVALKRAANDLSDFQKKIVRLDEHMGISIAGLLSDGRILARFMESECISWRWAHDEAVPVVEIVEKIEDKLQTNTQFYGRRPFGVGLLIAAYDDKGPHIMQTCPSANVYECKAMAIGARSQSARTYLDKHLEEFATAGLEELVTHALCALRDTLPNEIELNAKNTTVAVVGKGTPFKLYDDEAVQEFVGRLEDKPRAVYLPPDGAIEDDDAAGAAEGGDAAAADPIVDVATDER